jgi:hypothetical protein
MSAKSCGSELRALINTQPNPRSAHRRRSLHTDCWQQQRTIVAEEPTFQAVDLNCNWLGLTLNSSRYDDNASTSRNHSMPFLSLIALSLHSSLVDCQKGGFQIGRLIELIAASMRSISVVPSGAMRTSVPSRPVDNRRDNP